MIGCEAAGCSDPSWRSVSLRGLPRRDLPGQRNSFNLSCDYLDEADEGNFIIPDPVYNDDAFNFKRDRYQDVLETGSSSLMSVNSSAGQSMKKRKKRYKEHRRSRHSVENETLLMEDIVYDNSKGARPKIYSFHSYKKPDTLGKFHKSKPLIEA